MAITNAQQYQQLVNKPANGKRPGYRGPGGYQGSSGSSSSSSSSNQGPAGGASAGGNYGGNVNAQQTYAGRTYANQNYATQASINAANQRAAQSAAAAKARAAQIAAEKAEKDRQKREADAAKAAKARAKAIADKKAKDLSNVGKSKTSKFGTVVSSLKEKNKKFQNKKNIDLANKIAFQKYQDIEQYVDMMDDYGLSAEELADKVKANETYGYDFSDLDKGLENLVSNKGTSIESIRKNLYDVNSPMYGITGLLTDKIRPDTQVTALNTLRKARDYRDLAGTGDVSRDDLNNLRNRGKTQEQIDFSGGRDNDPYIPPIISQQPITPVTPVPVVGSTTSSDPFSLAPRFMGSIFDFSGGRTLAADGGMMMKKEYRDLLEEDEMEDPTGGIMDLESVRDMYFVGGLVKSAKKAIKGATRAVKKVAKSPIGKAALLGLGAGMAGFGPASGLFGSGKGLAFKQFLMGGKTLPSSMGFKSKGLLGGILNYAKANPYKSIFGGSALLGLMGQKEEEEGIDLDEYYKTQGIDIDAIRNNPDRVLARRFMAEGGDAEPVAKKTMPLLDMDGQEMDLREEGGFVPLGRMERADDVPARLSKNEFVFTADAVRNAGEGDIDKGAEVMYNMMKNLESGGEVSEESQGLEGAREMFQTSQRLEEVL